MVSKEGGAPVRMPLVGSDGDVLLLNVSLPARGLTWFVITEA
jgi:hypothetical protein